MIEILTIINTILILGLYWKRRAVVVIGNKEDDFLNEEESLEDLEELVNKILYDMYSDNMKVSE